MTRPRQQRATGTMRGALVLAVLLVMLLLCLARVHAAATASSLAGPSPENGGVKTAAAGAVVPERLDTEVSINDYPESRANGRHNPSHP